MESHLETSEHAAASAHLKLREELQALAQFTNVADRQVVFRLSGHESSAELMFLLVSLIVGGPVEIGETHARHHRLK